MFKHSRREVCNRGIGIDNCAETPSHNRIVKHTRKEKETNKRNRQKEITQHNGSGKTLVPLFSMFSMLEGPRPVDPLGEFGRSRFGYEVELTQ